MNVSCDRLNLVISPKTALCCSDFGTKQLMRRGLLQLEFSFKCADRRRDLGLDREVLVRGEAPGGRREETDAESNAAKQEVVHHPAENSISHPPHGH